MNGKSSRRLKKFGGKLKSVLRRVLGIRQGRH